MLVDINSSWKQLFFSGAVMIVVALIAAFGGIKSAQIISSSDKTTQSDTPSSNVSVSQTDNITVESTGNPDWNLVSNSSGFASHQNGKLTLEDTDSNGLVCFDDQIVPITLNNNFKLNAVITSDGKQGTAFGILIGSEDGRHHSFVYHYSDVSVHDGEQLLFNQPETALDDVSPHLISLEANDGNYKMYFEGRQVLSRQINPYGNVLRLAICNGKIFVEELMVQ